MLVARQFTIRTDNEEGSRSTLEIKSDGNLKKPEQSN